MHARRPGGFTLIEVLIVMTLMGIMVVLLFGTLKISAESWEKGEAKIAEVNSVAGVYNFFYRHLLASKPLWDDFSEPDSRILGFQGDAQHLQFVSSFPASADKHGLQWFTLRVHDQGQRLDIAVSISPFFPIGEGRVRPPPEEAILFKGVSRLEFAYFGENPETGLTAWQPTWLDRDTLPKLIRIAIASEQGGDWPELIIPLKLSGAKGVVDDIGIGADTEPEDEDGGMDGGDENVMDEERE